MFSSLVPVEIMLLPIVDADPHRSWLIDRYVTDDGFRVSRYRAPLQAIPADFFADPDGSWTFEALTAAAGFSSESGVAVGALRQPLFDHPDGAAVVTLNAETRPYVAIVECPIAFELVADARRTETSAA
jgi:hypothetical protein